MTTAYDMKLTKNLWYLLPQSVVQVVVVPVRLHNVSFRRNGFFQGRPDRRTRTENKNTLLADIVFTHIVCTEYQCHKCSYLHAQNPYQFPSFYRNVLPTRRLLPHLTWNFNNNCLWQQINKQHMLLTVVACGLCAGPSITAPSFALSNELLLRLSSASPIAPGSVVGHWK